MLGALDRPQDMAPAYHYGVEGQLPWIDCASVAAPHDKGALHGRDRQLRRGGRPYLTLASQC
jgi:hypothetical protein